jgi:hypothetical protein
VLLQVFEKVGKSMRKGRPKVIVDAERNRRTLEKPANHVPWFGGGASSKSTKQVPKTASKVKKKAPKWVPKSMQNRAGAAETFGELSGGQKRLRIIVGGVVLGPILGPVLRKSRKNTVRKGIQKSM